jgi:glucose-6-phosphate isomerase
MRENKFLTKFTYNLGNYQTLINTSISFLEQNDILNRIQQHDFTVWKPDPQEISNRLAWLDIAAEFTSEKIAEMVTCRDDLVKDGYQHAILLGMGGSSLAPELFSQIFSPNVKEKTSLSLSILDSTCPQSVQDIAARNDLDKTVFIVSTKSGTTEETLSFFKYFYRLLANRSIQNLGDHFIAITDPGSPLETIAQKLKFRHVFLNNPNLGGRYSALSHFGLAPATICGVEIPTLLRRVNNMADICRRTHELQENPAVMLGVTLGELANSGCDKVTLIASPTLKPFCDWVEQLLAESTGKEGKGILPVVDEPLTKAEYYGKDRLFVILELSGEEINHDRLLGTEFPIIKIKLDDIYDLGGQFYLWELATAIAGFCLGINPFDQPNVEATKKYVRGLVDAYKKTGTMPLEQSIFSEAGISVFGEGKFSSLKECLQNCLEQAKTGNYIALQAFLYPNNIVHEHLQEFRVALRDKTKLATTLGFGPRYLHSTGQLHKGDGGNGLFIQMTSDFPQDIPIPDSPDADSSSLSFGRLIQAQARGDALALHQAGRRVIRFHFSGDPSAAIALLHLTLKSN